MNSTHDTGNAGGASSAELAKLVYRQDATITTTRYGDEGLVVVPKQADQIALNDVGMRVLELVDGHNDAGSIAAQIQEEFDNDDRDAVLRDVVEILRDLEGRGVVEPVD